MSQPATENIDITARYRGGRLNSFFNLSPGDADAALSLHRPCDRSGLSASLDAYARRLSAPRAAREAIARLAHPKSRAVVAGQQTGLLLGPTYTLVKAVAAVKLARQLDTDERPVIPIFWLASQDGDTAEVDHAFLLDLREQLTRVWLPLPRGVPVGRIVLDRRWVSSVTEQLAVLDVPDHYRAECLELLDEGAQGAVTPSDWFGSLLYKLLGPSGLVVVNPIERDVATLALPTLKREIADPLTSARLINDAAARLADLGEAAQLGRGQGSTNLFVEEDDGRRRPLKFHAGSFSTERTVYHTEELLALCEDDASRVTPAAGLRPVVQDALLPTAITVVGPGELGYFAQLKGVYDAHQVEMPLIWPRPTVTVLEPPVKRIIRKFGLELDELVRDFEAVRCRTLNELHGHGVKFEEARGALEHAMAQMLEQIRPVDPTLQRTVSRAGERIARNVELIEAKAGRALAERDDIYSRQFQRLERHLFPAGAPQERSLSPFSFFLKFGIEPVLDRFLSLSPEGRHVVEL